MLVPNRNIYIRDIFPLLAALSSLEFALGDLYPRTIIAL